VRVGILRPTLTFSSQAYTFRSIQSLPLLEWYAPLPCDEDITAWSGGNAMGYTRTTERVRVPGQFAAPGDLVEFIISLEYKYNLLAAITPEMLNVTEYPLMEALDVLRAADFRGVPESNTNLRRTLEPEAQFRFEALTLGSIDFSFSGISETVHALLAWLDPMERRHKREVYEHERLTNERIRREEDEQATHKQFLHQQARLDAEEARARQKWIDATLVSETWLKLAGDLYAFRALPADVQSEFEARWKAQFAKVLPGAEMMGVMLLPDDPSSRLLTSLAREQADAGSMPQRADRQDPLD
jgi:hypothetical protein